MKQNSIQQLLEKYREGTLSEAELAELTRLTHKDEVIDAASHRAERIIMRRRVTWASLTMVALLIVGVGIRAVMPEAEIPVLMAEHHAPAIIQQQQGAEEVLSTTPAVQEAVPAPARNIKSVPHRTSENKIAKTVTVEPIEEKPEVICNNFCEADSVINDIKRFLSV